MAYFYFNAGVNASFILSQYFNNKSLEATANELLLARTLSPVFFVLIISTTHFIKIPNISNVVHFRNLPSDFSEIELVSIL